MWQTFSTLRKHQRTRQQTDDLVRFSALRRYQTAGRPQRLTSADTTSNRWCHQQARPAIARLSAASSASEVVQLVEFYRAVRDS
jgi:hypothetical protein